MIDFLSSFQLITFYLTGIKNVRAYFLQNLNYSKLYFEFHDYNFYVIFLSLQHTHIKN